MVTRVAPSFLRFGHFEHFAHTAQDEPSLKRLLDATTQRYFPGTGGPAALLEEVARRTARLIAQWQLVGFCHGVMNTDNMSLLGLTIDYGPFGFLDAFDPMHVCNHSDDQGRYAYARQPSVAFWNLHALAQALLPLVEGPKEAASEQLLAALEPYKAEFAAAMVGGLRAKLGLVAEHEDDAALADDLLKLMAEDRADFTITWRRMSDLAAARDCFMQRDKFDAWAERYRARLALESSDDSDTNRPHAPRQPEVRAAKPSGANRDRIRAARRLFGNAAPAESSRAPLRRTTGKRSRRRLPAHLGHSTRSLLLLMTTHDHDDPRYPVKKTDEAVAQGTLADAVRSGAPRRHRAAVQRRLLGPLG